MAQADLPKYPYSDAVLVEGDLAVVDCRGSHLCGYCAFKVGEIPSGWHGNYDAPGLQFLAVHGGITYAECEGDYAVFGFDCAHASDDARAELKDPAHVIELARQMREQLAAFASRQEEWERLDRAGRLALLDEVRDQAKLPTEVGFGGLIEVLFGVPSIGEPA